MDSEVKENLKKADESFREIEHLMAEGFYPAVVGRAYATMLQAANAALMAKKVEGARQSIVLTFDEAFVKTGLLDKKYDQYFRRAYNSRTKSDQASFASTDLRQARVTLLMVKDFIAACRNLCEQTPDSK